MGRADQDPARDDLVYWSRQVEIAANRADREPRPSDGAAIAVATLAIALRNIDRAARLCARHAPDLIEPALERFHREIWDDHGLPAHHVRGGHVGSPRLDRDVPEFAWDGSTYRLAPDNRFSLDVDGARGAATTLSATVLDALHTPA